MRFHRYIVVLLIVLCPMLRAQVLINELMQSNIDCIMDDLHDFPDSWVELYNNTDGNVDLGAYKLGINKQVSDAYQLPSQQLAPHAFVLVYCDKVGKNMHTHFRLESGENACVYLFRNGQVADSVVGLAKQPSPNIAYGRSANGATSWGYQQTPTPGGSNTGLAQGVLGSPIFSNAGYVQESGNRFTLTLSVPAGSPAGTEIRYTMNGAEPTPDDPLFTSTLYFTGTRVIRAKLFCPGYASPRSVTHSYITPGRVMDLPVVSIVTNEQYFYDNQLGLYPNSSQDWRRPINIELFTDGDTQAVINQLCETRIQGGASRGCKLKSLALYANKRFGQSRFNYEFFPDERPGKNVFQSISLRNAGNDFDYLYLRDAVIQRVMSGHADIDHQAWRPAVVYINGEYKGMLNFRERTNEENIIVNYGIEDIDMLENGWDLKAGTGDNWWAFQSFYAEHGHSWAEYEQWVDCKEYINLMLMNLFFNNQDFPGNNVVEWRPRTGTSSLPARWRFIAKDTDFGLGLYGTPASYNTIAWLNNPDYDADHAWANSWDATRLFRRLMEDTTFHREFLDRAAIYMGDFLNYDSVMAVWQPMYEMIKNEITYHRRVNTSWVNYQQEMNAAQQWLRNRPAEFGKQLADYYGLKRPLPLQINNELSDEDAAEVKVIFNGVPLTCNRWSGAFYAERNISLKSENPRVIGWTLTISTSTSRSRQTYQGNSCSFTIPSDVSLIQANAILSEPSALIEQEASPLPVVEKRIQNGRVVIVRDGVVYDVCGRRL